MSSRHPVLILLALAATLSLGTAAHAAPRAPVPTGPGAGATVSAVPAFGWRPAQKAASYDFQLAADSRFRSPVDGGSVRTSNTYAVPGQALPDGTYWWRVRGVDAGDHAGTWSRARRLNKLWGSTAAMLAPGAGQPLVYPRDPVVLRWSSVPGAWKYRV